MSEKTYVKVDENVFHLKTLKHYTAYYMCAWYIQNISSLKLISSQCFFEKVCNSREYHSSFEICPDPKGIKIEIKTCFNCTRFDISIASRSGKVPLKHSNERCDQSKNTIYRAFIEGEDFQNLKELPDSTSIIICQMKYCANGKAVPESTPAMNSEYINLLKADLKKCPATSSKEIVNLRVGEETERVNKAILCMRSPVFAKMFENDMKKFKLKTVTITDIKMPVLRVLVSFLCSGLVPDCDFDFLCQLYCAADKYDIKDLRLACIVLLVSKASLEDLLQLLKLLLSHNDELLKSVAMTLINANIKAIILTPDWKNFMLEGPEIALEAATFFDGD